VLAFSTAQRIAFVAPFAEMLGVAPDRQHTGGSEAAPTKGGVHDGKGLDAISHGPIYWCC
jgi:hypothetical protein